MANKSTRLIPPLRRAGGGQATIAVGLSGGVDSSVAAALLKKQGYKVVGFFMKNWSGQFGLKEADCPWYQDRQDAMAVAAKLDIPFHTLDFEEEYKNQVLDYFFSEYAAGRTPNPDVMCNATIKFGVFLDKALALGADYIATGHYARLTPSDSPLAGGENRAQFFSSPPAKEGLGGGLCQLLKAKDSNKDQTYFLYRLTQNQLSKAMFPIGEYTKPEVRALAKKFGLPTQDKPDSQGVCFIGHIDLRKFLSQKIKDQPGDIVTVDGKIVGQHAGLFWYTIGQRKGIEIGGIGPFYVVEKDLQNNKLIVTHDAKDERLYKSVVEFNNVNWIVGEPPLNLPQVTTPKILRSFWGTPGQGETLITCTGRIRYREPLVECKIEKMDSRNDNPTYRATFAEPLRAVAAGQSIVFYDRDTCIGGGIIN